jgi:hypothetical protein
MQLLLTGSIGCDRPAVAASLVSCTLDVPSMSTTLGGICCVQAVPAIFCQATVRECDVSCVCKQPLAGHACAMRHQLRLAV